MSKKKIPEKPKPSSAGIYQPTSSSYVGSLKRRINDTKQSTLASLFSEISSPGEGAASNSDFFSLKSTTIAPQSSLGGFDDFNDDFFSKSRNKTTTKNSSAKTKTNSVPTSNMSALELKLANSAVTHTLGTIVEPSASVFSYNLSNRKETNDISFEEMLHSNKPVSFKTTDTFASSSSYKPKTKATKPSPDETVFQDLVNTLKDDEEVISETRNTTKPTVTLSSSLSNPASRIPGVSDSLLYGDVSKHIFKSQASTLLTKTGLKSGHVSVPNSVSKPTPAISTLSGLVPKSSGKTQPTLPFKTRVEVQAEQALFHAEKEKERQQNKARVASARQLLGYDDDDNEGPSLIEEEDIYDLNDSLSYQATFDLHSASPAPFSSPGAAYVPRSSRSATKIASTVSVLGPPAVTESLSTSIPPTSTSTLASTSTSTSTTLSTHSDLTTTTSNPITRAKSLDQLPPDAFRSPMATKKSYRREPLPVINNASGSSVSSITPSLSGLSEEARRETESLRAALAQAHTGPSYVLSASKAPVRADLESLEEANERRRQRQTEASLGQHLEGEEGEDEGDDDNHDDNGIVRRRARPRRSLTYEVISPRFAKNSEITTAAVRRNAIDREIEDSMEAMKDLGEGHDEELYQGASRSIIGLERITKGVSGPSFSATKSKVLGRGLTGGFGDFLSDEVQVRGLDLSTSALDIGEARDEYHQDAEDDIKVVTETMAILRKIDDAGSPIGESEARSYRKRLKQDLKMQKMQKLGQEKQEQQSDGIAMTAPAVGVTTQDINQAEYLPSSSGIESYSLPLATIADGEDDTPIKPDWTAKASFHTFSNGFGREIDSLDLLTPGKDNVTMAVKDTNTKNAKNAKDAKDAKDSIDTAAKIENGEKNSKNVVKGDIYVPLRTSRRLNEVMHSSDDDVDDDKKDEKHKKGIHRTLLSQSQNSSVQSQSTIPKVRTIYKASEASSVSTESNKRAEELTFEKELDTDLNESIVVFNQNSPSAAAFRASTRAALVKPDDFSTTPVPGRIISASQKEKASITKLSGPFVSPVATKSLLFSTLTSTSKAMKGEISGSTSSFISPSASTSMSTLEMKLKSPPSSSLTSPHTASTGTPSTSTSRPTSPAKPLDIDFKAFLKKPLSGTTKTTVPFSLVPAGGKLSSRVAPTSTSKSPKLVSTDNVITATVITATPSTGPKSMLFGGSARKSGADIFKKKGDTQAILGVVNDQHQISRGTNSNHNGGGTNTTVLSKLPILPAPDTSTPIAPASSVDRGVSIKPRARRAMQTLDSSSSAEESETEKSQNLNSSSIPVVEPISKLAVSTMRNTTAEASGKTSPVTRDEIVKKHDSVIESAKNDKKRPQFTKKDQKIIRSRREVFSSSSSSDSNSSSDSSSEADAESNMGPRSFPRSPSRSGSESESGLATGRSLRRTARNSQVRSRSQSRSQSSRPSKANPPRSSQPTKNQKIDLEAVTELEGVEENILTDGVSKPPSNSSTNSNSALPSRSVTRSQSISLDADNVSDIVLAETVIDSTRASKKTILPSRYELRATRSSSRLASRSLDMPSISFLSDTDDPISVESSPNLARKHLKNPKTATEEIKETIPESTVSFEVENTEILTGANQSQDEEELLRDRMCLRQSSMITSSNLPSENKSNTNANLNFDFDSYAQEPPSKIRAISAKIPISTSASTSASTLPVSKLVFKGLQDIMSPQRKPASLDEITKQSASSLYRQSPLTSILPATSTPVMPLASIPSRTFFDPKSNLSTISTARSPDENETRSKRQKTHSMNLFSDNDDMDTLDGGDGENENVNENMNDISVISIASSINTSVRDNILAVAPAQRQEMEELETPGSSKPIVSHTPSALNSSNGANTSVLDSTIEMSVLDTTLELDESTIAVDDNNVSAATITATTTLVDQASEIIQHQNGDVPSNTTSILKSTSLDVASAPATIAPQLHSTFTRAVPYSTSASSRPGLALKSGLKPGLGLKTSLTSTSTALSFPHTFSSRTDFLTLPLTTTTPALGKDERMSKVTQTSLTGAHGQTAKLPLVNDTEELNIAKENYDYSWLDEVIKKNQENESEDESEHSSFHSHADDSTNLYELDVSGLGDPFTHEYDLDKSLCVIVASANSREEVDSHFSSDILPLEWEKTSFKTHLKKNQKQHSARHGVDSKPRLSSGFNFGEHERMRGQIQCDEVEKMIMGENQLVTSTRSNVKPQRFIGNSYPNSSLSTDAYGSLSVFGDVDEEAENDHELGLSYKPTNRALLNGLKPGINEIFDQCSDSESEPTVGMLPLQKQLYLAQKKQRKAGMK